MSGGAACVDGMSSMDMDEEQAERLQQAVEVVAEMQLTAEQLKVRAGWLASCILAPPPTRRTQHD
jgi:hypothetical protein